jgi:hypothetical protein
LRSTQNPTVLTVKTTQKLVSNPLKWDFKSEKSY